MKTVVFDIEADNLLEHITKVWVIACTDMEGKEQKVFTDQDCEGLVEPAGSLLDGVKHLLQQDRVVCHNMMGYDWHVLHKFWPDLWNIETVPFKKCWDTFVQSKVQHFDRTPLKGTRSRHGLEYYGLLFKYPKPPVEDWTVWDVGKLNRVLVDIEINRKTLLYLNKEASDIGLDFDTQRRRTQAAQYWYALQEAYGWKGDKQHMLECVEDLDGKVKTLADDIEPMLPKQIKPKAVKCTWEDIRDRWDKFFRKVPATKFDVEGKEIKPARMPTHKVYLKNGMYDKHTALHFGIDQDPEKSDRMIGGAYTRIEILDSKLTQHAVVKDFLLSQGWKPTQWNFKKSSDGSLLRDASGGLVKSTPKLTEDSFNSIKGGVGQKIAQYNTYMHRRRTFKNEKDVSKGWVNQLREGSGRIPAGAMAWQTSTGRAAQFGIVNVPSGAALYGAEMRRSWICPEDSKLIAVDMDSAQLRLLANYMDDEGFTEAVLEGEEFDKDHKYIGTDAHTFNGRFFGLIGDGDWEEARKTQDEGLIKKVGKARKLSKNGIYALLFGAGDAKFAQTLGYRSSQQGAQVKKTYFTRLPKVKALLDKLERQWKENPWRGGGYIQVAGGTWVWCPSQHKLLNYLLMGSEGALQNEAICWVNMQILKRGMSGKQLGGQHDELTFEFLTKEEKVGKALLSNMYGQVSDKMDLEVRVTGTAQSGNSWLDIH